MADRNGRPPTGPTPTHERPTEGTPQPLPVPAPRPHPQEPPLPRRTPGGSL